MVGRAAEGPAFLRGRSGVDYVCASYSHALWADQDDARLGLVLAVGDDALPSVAEEWAERLSRHAPPGPLVALHTSGFHSAAVLEPIAGLDGASVGGWHPLMAIAAPAAGVFAGVTVGIEGDAPAIAWAEDLCRTVGATPVPVPAGEKARYHAAAVFASNYLVACLGVALAELESATGGSLGESSLLPLARAAIDNVASRGLAAGATGPLVRGDVHTIEGHIAALDPGRAALYRALGRELLELVRERTSPEDSAALRTVLGED